MRKDLLWMLLVVSLILAAFSALDMNMVGVIAAEYPAIYIIPQETWNTGLTPDMNYTVSIYTNYTGDDVWGYQFTLYYNPSVLHAGINKTDMWTATGSPVYYTSLAPVVTGSEKIYVNGELKTKGVHYLITYKTGRIFFLSGSIPLPPAQVKAVYIYGILNGDLITVGKNASATFEDKPPDNTLGKLPLTKAYFSYPPMPVPITSGPGILANITFTVVGNGFSDITLGADTKLIGWSDVWSSDADFPIIDANIMPEHIQHGFFCNIPPRHDVAVVSLEAPDTVAVEQPVPINVTVASKGTYDESVTLTVYNGTTVIDSTSFTLKKGLSEKRSYEWDTSGVPDATYTINATAAISVDDNPVDNSATKLVTLVSRHDVAVVSLEAPDTVAVNQPVPVSVTVRNEGSYDESVTLTVYNETTVVASTSFTLAKGPTSNTSSFIWDTSGVGDGTYTINATATTVSVDDEPGDNSDTKTVTLEWRHDVAVVSLVAPTYKTVGHIVPISVTVANEGSYPESVSLTVYYDTTLINSTSFTLAKGPTSNTVSFDWKTSGVAQGTYTINATATITPDDDLSDNNKTKTITLMLIRNVRVVRIRAPLRGNVDDNVLINVTVENTGSYTETFNVTTQYDNTTIVLSNGKNYITVTLAPTESTAILFTWNTTGVIPGRYILNATASEVENETNTSDNSLLSRDPVLVTILGDVDGDGAVSTSDLTALSEAYGSEPVDSNWDPYCDFNSDDKIDASDVFNLGKNYGKSVP